MSHRLRPLAVPFLVKPPRGVRVRSRLRVSDRDALVLWALGLYLGRLANQDLALRCGQGTAGGDGRTERKRALTGEASSRWAGAITRTSNDQWERGLRNRRDQQLGLLRAIANIERRLAAPVGARGGHSRGYASQAERFQKQRRLQMLKARLAQLEARLVAGRVSVTRGGRELARLRHNLEPAGLSEARWRERWEAERLFITADGEADKHLGNETMPWHPEQQWLEIKLAGLPSWPTVPTAATGSTARSASGIEAPRSPARPGLGRSATTSATSRSAGAGTWTPPGGCRQVRFPS